MIDTLYIFRALTLLHIVFKHLTLIWFWRHIKVNISITYTSQKSVINWWYKNIWTSSLSTAQTRLENKNSPYSNKTSEKLSQRRVMIYNKFPNMSLTGEPYFLLELALLWKLYIILLSCIEIPWKSITGII